MDTGGVILSIVFVLIGLGLAIWPEPLWRLRHLFSFANPDDVIPSRVVLVYYRVSGVVAILIGALLLWWMWRMRA
jgi:uncharacterized protein YjeT (DUF2065 family)